MEDEHLIRQLHDRLLAAQHTDGSWRVYQDEEDGNLSATVECYYALLYSGYSRETDDPMLKAKRFILSKGGLRNINAVLTKIMLAATGQYPWPATLMIPLEFVLLPSSFPISIFDFSGYARVHFIPVLLLTDRQFAIKTNRSPAYRYSYIRLQKNGRNDTCSNGLSLTAPITDTQLVRF
jgi:sporulenol synthase